MPIYVRKETPENYTFQYKMSKAGSVSYSDDASGFTAAKMNFTTDTFNYGSWGTSKFIVNSFPVALNLDGTVAYRLDPHDYTKKVDGTPSDITFTLLTEEPSDWSTRSWTYYKLIDGKYVRGTEGASYAFEANTYYKLGTTFAGNFMIAFPKIYFYRTNDGTNAIISVSDHKVATDYRADAHINANGQEVDYIYLPMFKGSIIDGKLRSIPGVIPEGGLTAAEEVAAAEACGPGWQIWDHSSREMINDLLTMISKDHDAQASFGPGRTRYNGQGTSYNNEYKKLPTGSLFDKGPFYGYKANTTLYLSDVKVFGIEGYWGNREERLQGLLFGKAITVPTFYTKMQPPYNFTDTTGWVGNSASNISNGFIQDVLVRSEGTIPTRATGTSDLYYHDYISVSMPNNYTTTRYVPYVGGNSGLTESYRFRPGLRNYTVQDTGTAAWYVGASPVYKPL